MDNPRLIRLTAFIGLFLAVWLAGCTRSRSADVVPTTAPESVDVTMQAVLAGTQAAATQTAQALLPPGSGGGGDLTATPIALGTVIVPPTVTLAPTATPLPTDTPPAPTTYTVKQGDWLYKIARDLGVSVEALIAANPGIDPNNIQPGQVLNVPQPGAAIAQPTVAAGPTTYVVQPGEWIYQIARKLGKDPKAIIAANPGIDANNVQPGQVLNIP